jgi:hypothetical protein
MTTATHTAFPSDETLAAFIDGRLDPETRKQVLEHMVTCEPCYATFLMASEMRAKEGAGANGRPSTGNGLQGTTAGTGQTPGGTVVRGSFGRKALIGIPAAFAAAAVLVVFFREPIRERYEDYKFSRMDGMTALVAAANESATRPIDGRLMGAYSYKPLKPTTRGAPETEFENTIVERKVLYAASKISDDAKRAATVRSSHNLGVAYLALKDFKASVTALEATLHAESGTARISDAIRQSSDAGLLTDLSAAYLARAHQGSGESDYELALEASDRAWSIARNPGAAWNRAVALERLHHQEKAKAAWRDYLQIDASSEWSIEARNRLRDLADP